MFIFFSKVIWLRTLSNCDDEEREGDKHTDIKRDHASTRGMHKCVCACDRRGCTCVCACVRACVHVCVCTSDLLSLSAKEKEMEGGWPCLGLMWVLSIAAVCVTACVNVLGVWVCVCACPCLWVMCSTLLLVETAKGKVAATSPSLGRDPGLQQPGRRGPGLLEKDMWLQNTSSEEHEPCCSIT